MIMQAQLVAPPRAGLPRAARVGAGRSSSMPTPRTPRRARRGRTSSPASRPTTRTSRSSSTSTTRRATRNRSATGSPAPLPMSSIWYAGYRMRQFVTPGLLEDVSDLYDAGGEGVDSSFGARSRQRRAEGSTAFRTPITRSDCIFAAISSPRPASRSRRGTGRIFSPPAPSSRQRASSRSRSARATSGPPPRGSTTSICGSTASRSTWT